LGVRLTPPPHKKVLLGNLNWRPRPTQGCRADDDIFSIISIIGVGGGGGGGGGGVFRLLDPQSSEELYWLKFG
jgi:hypothetical protein